MKVRLLDATDDPLKLLAVVKAKMRGEVLSKSDITIHQAEEEFNDSINTGIYGLFEFVNFTFDISEVTRAFTHQLVRTRNASYVQESMRFSVHRGEQFQYLEDLPTISGDAQKRIYREGMQTIQILYEMLLDNGVAPEDARGVLPTNILTTIAMKIDYRNLLQLAEQRLCMQSQEEHRNFVKSVKSLIHSQVHPLLAQHLVPSCERLGYCKWGSKLDRPCPLQEKYPIKRA